MLGFAQKSFLEKGGKLPLSSCNVDCRKLSWPLIERAVTAGWLAYVDYAMAEKLLKQDPQASEAVASVICHLSAASRHGHLCVSVQDGVIHPDPSQIWVSRHESTQDMLSHGNYQAIRELICLGFKQLPDNVCSIVDNGLAPDSLSAPLFKMEELLYFKRAWNEEGRVIGHFRQLLASKPCLLPDLSKIENQLTACSQSGALLPEQADAVRNGSKHCFGIICGGPGTGKSYTAAQFIKTFWHGLSNAQQQTCEIAISAPTGKAAANLQRYLTQACAAIEGFPKIQAKTLHSLLGMGKSTSDPAHNTLTADLVIVDESSMIDADLMGHLVTAIKPGARLILIGDRHQLPPVATGALFSEMIKYLQKKAPKYVTELKTCIRAELQHLVEFAEIINRGDAQSAISLLNKEHDGLLRCNLSDDAKKGQQALLQQAWNYYPLSISDDPQHIFTAFAKFRILSPVRKGYFGVDTLNALFRRHARQQHSNELCCVAPIILTSNDHSLELSNGEVGILVQRMCEEGSECVREGDYALFPSRENPSQLRKVPALLLPPFEYAYCLSVHKSQGSEFDHVILLMPESAEAFGREILYTAATRSRKKLEIWGSETTLKKTILRHSERLSGISVRMEVEDNRNESN